MADLLPTPEERLIQLEQRLSAIESSKDDLKAKGTRAGILVAALATLFLGYQVYHYNEKQNEDVPAIVWIGSFVFIFSGLGVAIPTEEVGKLLGR